MSKKKQEVEQPQTQENEVKSTYGQVFDQLLKDVCEAVRACCIENAPPTAQTTQKALRNVLADWCQDENLAVECECLNWMSRTGKRPYTTDKSAAWFNSATVAPGLGDLDSDVPGEVYKRLDGGKEVANHKDYPSQQEAELAFLAAWKKARTEDDWSPKE